MIDRMLRWRVASAALVLTACGARPANQTSSGGAPRECQSHPTGLHGSFVVKFESGFNYMPKGGNPVLTDLRETFRDRLLAQVAGSSVQLTEAQGQAQDINLFLSLMNDGADNFHAVMNIWGVTTPAKGYLLVYTQPYTYTDPIRAVEDAADTMAGYMKNGWSCN